MQVQFLLMKYDNKNKNMYSFGYYLLELNSNGSELTGSFVGYGANSAKIINGAIYYKKER